MCCSPWGYKVGHNWAAELSWTDFIFLIFKLLLYTPESGRLSKWNSYDIQNLVCTEEFLCKQIICKGSLQWSPTYLTPGTRKIVEDNFSMDSAEPGGDGEDMGGGFRMIQGHYNHCAWYFCYYISSIWNHQAIDPGMLGTHYRGSRKECLGRCWHQPYVGNSWRNSLGRTCSINSQR